MRGRSRQDYLRAGAREILQPEARRLSRYWDDIPNPDWFYPGVMSSCCHSVCPFALSSCFLMYSNRITSPGSSYHLHGAKQNLSPRLAYTSIVKGTRHSHTGPSSTSSPLHYYWCAFPPCPLSTLLCSSHVLDALAPAFSGSRIPRGLSR